jgi:hypothetical protein
MIGALTIWNMILSFCIKILLKSCKYWKQLHKVFFPLCKTIVRTLRPLSKYCPSKVPFKFPLPLHKVKIECMYRVLLKFMFSKKATQIDKIWTLLNWLQLMIFTICLGRRVCCTQAMKIFWSLEFIHTVFLTNKEAIYKIPIKPCVRNLIQSCSVERIRLNKTWMTLKMIKILVSLLVMNPLKKKWQSGIWS